MTVTVSTTAWRAVGAPVRDDSAVGGVCARCGQPAELTAAHMVVSKSFTAFDDWVDPSGHGLCPGCCWAYTTTELRLTPHLVTADPPALRTLTRLQAGRHLQAGRVDGGHAMILPLRPGRKHLLPSASWGQVTVDDAHLTWTDTDAHRLRTVAFLRQLGFGTRMLAAAAPPFTGLQRLPPRDWTQVTVRWSELDPWRINNSPWLALALHVTVSPDPATSKESIR